MFFDCVLFIFGSNAGPTEGDLLGVVGVDVRLEQVSEDAQIVDHPPYLYFVGSWMAQAGLASGRAWGMTQAEQADTVVIDRSNN